MQNRIKIMVEFGQQANVLARSASAESTCLREAHERLAEVVARMSELADSAAQVASDFHDRLLVAECDLRPATQIIALMTGILKRVKELSETVERTVQSQTAATRDLVGSVGETAKGSARITGQIMNLAEAVGTVLQKSDNKSTLKAELISLTAGLRDFVAHFRAGHGGPDVTGPEAGASQVPDKPPCVN